MKLGTKVRDTVTGYEGTVTARIEYLNGSPRCEVEARVEDVKGDDKSRWIEEERLEAIG